MSVTERKPDLVARIEEKIESLDKSIKENRAEDRRLMLEMIGGSPR